MEIDPNYNPGQSPEAQQKSVDGDLERTNSSNRGRQSSLFERTEQSSLEARIETTISESLADALQDPSHPWSIEQNHEITRHGSDIDQESGIARHPQALQQDAGEWWHSIPALTSQNRSGEQLAEEVGQLPQKEVSDEMKTKVQKRVARLLRRPRPVGCFGVTLCLYWSIDLTFRILS